MHSDEKSEDDKPPAGILKSTSENSPAIEQQMTKIEFEENFPKASVRRV